MNSRISISQIRYFIVFVLLISLYQIGRTHEVRPAYLKITELSENQYQLFWKVPTYQGKYINIFPIIEGETSREEVRINDEGDALIREFEITTVENIKGKFLSVQNIEKTLIDVLVEIQFADDVQYTSLLQPSRSRYLIPAEYSTFEVIKTYFILGVEHILLGYDHLLFVLGLFLLIPGISKLIKTITAFTLAHSITLILASLELISIPSPPVEAIIAISIVLLAVEVIRKEDGHVSLTSKFPWTVAFLFGLIHGLGFAGALQDIGLPQKSVTSALLLFNLGVEAGQILFLLALYLVIYTFCKLFSNIRPLLYRLLCYLIGITGIFWTIERVLSF